MTIEDLIENFELLEDWEDKYRYLIDLGSKLEHMPEEYYTEDWKVRGCQSQVWLVPKKQENKFYFVGDSDAAIVKGIIYIVLTIFNSLTAEEIKNVDINNIFTRLGLNEHLSPSRRNGLSSMTEKILYYANIL